jgi:hypothetical protein
MIAPLKPVSMNATLRENQVVAKAEISMRVHQPGVLSPNFSMKAACAPDVVGATTYSAAIGVDHHVGAEIVPLQHCLDAEVGFRQARGALVGFANRGAHAG